MTDADPVEVAAKALRHRDRSRRQVEQRLAQAGIGEDARADALDTLERVGYVDDGRYAAGRAAALAERGYGDEAIRHLLGEEGVAADGVEAAIGALAPEAERAEGAAAKLGRTPKVAARLERKGFGPDVLETVFGTFETDSQ